MQNKCVAQAKEVVTKQDSDLVIGVSVVEDQKKRPATTTKNDHLTKLLTCHQKSPGIHVFEHSSNRCVDEEKERRRSRITFPKVAKIHLTLLKKWYALFVFATKTRRQNKMPVQIHASIIKLNKEEVSASVQYDRQVNTVGDRLLPESKKEKAKEPPQPTQDELSVKVSPES